MVGGTGKRKREVKRIWVSPKPIDEEEEEEEGKHVYVKVKHEEGEQQFIRYKIERNLPLRWLMIKYCTSVKLDYETTRFFFNGARLRQTDTPLQLSILDSDVIHVFTHPHPLPLPDPVPTPGVHGRTGAHFVTVCIRIHNRKDTFLRLQNTSPILHQLKRCLLSEDVPEKGSWSLCFVYDGVKLTQDHTAEQLNMEDGDVIDGFDFDDNCSLSIMYSPTVTVKVEDLIGNKYVFTLYADTPLIRMLNKYCKLESIVNTRDIFFFHNGAALKLQKTAKEAKLEDGDMISALRSQGRLRQD